MTRVNLISPKELMDQHLFAEWRELKMIPRSLRRSLSAAIHATKFPNDPFGDKYVLSKIPKAYTLGTGHVSFFYDKATYIRDRYELLTAELMLRGYKFNAIAPVDELGVWSYLTEEFHKDYIPTPIALELVTNRINSKISEKPEWYRYYKQPLKNWRRKDAS